MNYSQAPHIKTTGSSLQCGELYGRQTASRVQRSLDAYRAMFKACDISWEKAQSQALPCMEIAFKAFPHLEDEIYGLAKGAAVDFESLAALNCRTEILPPDYLSRATGLANAQLPDNGHLTECTSFAFQRDNAPVWLAQNWDWIGSQRDSLVLHESVSATGSPYITLTEAGMLAKIGFNGKGFGVTLNILRSADDGKQPGMPIHLFLRGLLDCNSVAEALDLTANTRFSGSSNIMISDPTGDIASIEAAPAGARILRPESGQLCHTNHFLHAELLGGDTGLTGNISTEGRFETASQLIGTTHNIESIRTLLSDTSNGLQSICRFPDETLPPQAQVETVVAVAMNLTERTLWLSAAQPSITPLEPYTLSL